MFWKFNEPQSQGFQIKYPQSYQSHPPQPTQTPNYPMLRLKAEKAARRGCLFHFEHQGVRKMSTNAQIAANQLNASLSTGPRTQEGKSASSQNAQKHGLTCAYPVIRSEDERTQFETLTAKFEYEVRPSGQSEMVIFKQLILAAWNIDRCHRLEVDLNSNSEIDPQLDESLSKTIARIETYRMRAERAFRDVPERAASLADRVSAQLSPPRWTLPRLQNVPATCPPDKIGPCGIISPRGNDEAYKTVPHVNGYGPSRSFSKAHCEARSRGAPGSDSVPDIS